MKVHIYIHIYIYIFFNAYLISHTFIVTSGVVEIPQRGASSGYSSDM